MRKVIFVLFLALVVAGLMAPKVGIVPVVQAAATPTPAPTPSCHFILGSDGNPYLVCGGGCPRCPVFDAGGIPIPPK